MSAARSCTGWIHVRPLQSNQCVPVTNRWKEHLRGIGKSRCRECTDLREKQDRHHVSRRRFPGIDRFGPRGLAPMHLQANVGSVRKGTVSWVSLLVWRMTLCVRPSLPKNGADLSSVPGLVSPVHCLSPVVMNNLHRTRNLSPSSNQRAESMPVGIGF